MLRLTVFCTFGQEGTFGQKVLTVGPARQQLLPNGM